MLARYEGFKSPDSEGKEGSEKEAKKSPDIARAFLDRVLHWGQQVSREPPAFLARWRPGRKLFDGSLPCTLAPPSGRGDKQIGQPEGELLNPKI